MPIYEFECKEGHITSELVKLGTETTKCKTCGAVAKKILSVPAEPIIEGYSYKNLYGLKKDKKGKKDGKKIDK